MKKSLLALAVLGTFAGIAQAQTSVSIYGSFDAGIRDLSNTNSGGNSRLTMSSNGTYNSNRLGFKGIEDLGGGLNAHFTLEQGFNSGTGTLNNNVNRFFDRSAFIGLGGQWGSVDLGRQFTVAYRTAGLYDPFNFKYTGIIPTSQSSVAAGVRVDNDIQYTGTFGPLTVRAEWALGEQPGSARNGSAQALGVSYAGGPLALGAAYTLRKQDVANTGAAPTSSAASSSYQDNRDWTLGGAYTFGPARIAAGYARETQDLVSGSTAQKNAWIGGSYDLTGALGLAAAYYDTRVDNISGGNQDGKRQLFIIGATYKLSKRTNFYADLDYTRFKDGLAGTGGASTTSQLPLSSPNGQSRMTGFSLGVNHVF
jgi:predicted porin